MLECSNSHAARRFGEKFIQKHAPTGDARAALMWTVNFTRRSRFRDSRISVILAVLTWAVSTTVSAGQPGWHQQSESYQVHLGAVPAGVADRDSALIQMHEIAPHGGVKGTEALRHIMMAGCKRSGYEGALNAAFSIGLIENDLSHINGEKNNLDIMMSLNGKSYCNFFTLHWNGP